MSLLTKKLQTQLEYIDYLIDSIKIGNLGLSYGCTVFAEAYKWRTDSKGKYTERVHGKLSRLFLTTIEGGYSYLELLEKTSTSNFQKALDELSSKIGGVRLEIIEQLQKAIDLDKAKKVIYPCIYAKEVSNDKAFDYDQFLDYLEDAGLNENQIGNIKSSCNAIDKFTAALK